MPSTHPAQQSCPAGRVAAVEPPHTAPATPSTPSTPPPSLPSLQRLRRMAGDQQMWKCVCPAGHPGRTACLKRSSHIYDTLEAALLHCRWVPRLPAPRLPAPRPRATPRRPQQAPAPAAPTHSPPPTPPKPPACTCRPGDTVWLAPGPPHLVADLRLVGTVHLLGGGLRPEDTLLLAATGADAALDVRCGPVPGAAKRPLGGRPRCCCCCLSAAAAAAGAAASRRPLPPPPPPHPHPHPHPPTNTQTPAPARTGPPPS
jgi:hypothetical protein